MSEQGNYFSELNAINVNDKVEKKNGLTFLPWAWAWAEVKKVHPDAYYTIYENKDGWNYHTDGRTCWVKTGVTVNGLEHIEDLPVMDFRNASIPLDKVTSVDVNKAIQRSLTKAAARHGLGLYIYAGEDLPEGGEAPEPPKPEMETVEDAANYKLSFGKYSGKTLSEIFKADRKYLEWLDGNEKTDPAVRKGIAILYQAALRSQQERRNG